MPWIVGGFLVIICALRLIGRFRAVNFNTPSFLEDRCVRRGLINNTCKRVPQHAVREEMKTVDTHGQTVMQLRLRHRDNNAAK